jgi:hypothetical protein
MARYLIFVVTYYNVIPYMSKLTVCEMCDFAHTATALMDPLSAMWLATYDQCTSPNCAMARGQYAGYKLVAPNYVIKMYTQPHSIYKNVVAGFDVVGDTLGLWTCGRVYTTAESFFLPPIERYWCKVSNLYIERTATRAFLYMRLFVCKDVAGIIARMVAKLYLADIQWMIDESRYGYIEPGMIRHRITRWLSDDNIAKFNKRLHH